ncbi:MAG: alpha/beta hydrolase [Imperialibacter sp.]|uniref:alpha/beta fold hydrolase n=1 Tax=Imperialibacter sp. TaxID=2038411 RepID=UPI0032EBADA8
MKRVIVTFVSVVISVSLSFGQKAIEVEKTGSGTPVIFLPGFGTPGAVWNETVQNLAGSFESHLVTYAGFNGLAPIGTPWYAPIKDELIAYVKLQGLTNVTLVGHSMGGNLAVDLAAALPEQISGLILVESIPCMRELMMPGVPASSLQYDSPYNNQMIEMSDEAFRQMAEGMCSNMTLNVSKAEVLTGYFMKADRKTYVYGYTDLLKLDLRESLREISIPTLILGAPFPDKNVVLDNYEKQYANLTTKNIIIAENSKHFIMFDQPTWLYEHINKYLSQHAN